MDVSYILQRNSLSSMITLKKTATNHVKISYFFTCNTRIIQALLLKSHSIHEKNHLSFSPNIPFDSLSHSVCKVLSSVFSFTCAVLPFSFHKQAAKSLSVLPKEKKLSVTSLCNSSSQKVLSQEVENSLNVGYFFLKSKLNDKMLKYKNLRYLLIKKC